MTRFRFSLKGLFGFVAVVSIACGALAKPSDLWVGISQVLLFGYLFFALFNAAYGNPRVRAFGVGFAITGWTWLGLQLLQRPTRLALPTALLTDYL